MLPIAWPTLLIQPQCPLCHQAWSGHSFCPSCRDQLKLNEPSPQGSQPIPWRALGRDDAIWRRLILDLHRQASPNLIRALASECLALLPKPKAGVVLCAIPPRQGHQPGPPQWIEREICRQSGLRARHCCIAAELASANTISTAANAGRTSVVCLRLSRRTIPQQRWCSWMTL